MRWSRRHPRSPTASSSGGYPRACAGFRLFADDEPVQVADFYLPYDLVKGTRVEDPASEPWPGGTIAQLESLGIEVTEIAEDVAARAPDRRRSETSDWERERRSSRWCARCSPTSARLRLAASSLRVTAMCCHTESPSSNCVSVP